MPWPPTLAALAASASVPGYGAGSLSQSSQSNIASIGLRTQSITLMRDALYRLCEATANGTVSSLSATQLLARSQDLTAVVVAVEQLTGAVAANQAILTGTSNASASASLISDAAQLDTARKNRDQKQADLTQASKDRDTQQGVVKAQQDKVNAAQNAVNTPPAGADPNQLQATLADEKTTLATEQGKLDTAKAKVASDQQALDDAQQVVDTIENKNSAALTDAAAGTTGSGQFATVTPRIQLDKAATEQVARSVEGMVNTVLNKDYTTEACMTLLTNITVFKDLTDAQTHNLNTTVTQCTNLLNAKINTEIANLSVSNFGTDLSSERLSKALAADATLLPQLQAWVEASYSQGTVTQLIYGSENAILRQRAIQELSIP